VGRKKRVRVHTKDDQSFDGVLLRRVGDKYHLAVCVLKTGEGDKPMGDVLIPRINVRFMQVLES